MTQGIWKSTVGTPDCELVTASWTWITLGDPRTVLNELNVPNQSGLWKSD